MNKNLILILLLVSVVFFITCKSKNTRSLQVGDRIPQITLLDQNGQLINISDYTNKQALVIYFYPKDDTPGCTKEACKFRDEFEVFSALHAKVIGISSDDVSSHKAFAEKYHLPFTLLSDVDKKVRKQFGVPTFAGGIIPGRVTYIVDKKGTIRFVFNSMKQPEKHIEKAIEILKTL